jgi:predicted kinase
MMDEKIASNSIESKDIDSLIQALSKFYAGASRVKMTAAEFVDNLRNQIKANFVELFRDTHCLDQDILRRIRNRQLQFLEFNSDLWANRVGQSMIVDGHGDLRPEHICLEPIPKIFDCVEFSDSFRHLDILDELCFLALECERLGRDDIGKALLKSQNHIVNEGQVEGLIQFYMSYRACVRAKVALLRSLQSAGEDRMRALDLANKYLDLADRSMGCPSKPLCLIVRGLIGSGKSTIARRLSDRLGMTLIQSDRIRREIYSQVEASEAYGEGLYTAGSRNQVYEEILESAVASLSSRTSVILDACFLQKDLQQRVQYQVDAMGVRLIIVNCECPQEVAVTRVLERMKDPSCLSDARPEHWLDQARDDEGVIPGVPTININTAGAGPDALCDELITSIKNIVISESQESSRAKQESYCGTNAELSRSFETSRLATLARV